MPIINPDTPERKKLLLKIINIFINICYDKYSNTKYIITCSTIIVTIILQYEFTYNTMEHSNRITFSKTMV